MFGLIAWFVLSVLIGVITLWAVWSRSVSKWRLITVLGFLASLFISGGAVLLTQGWATKCSLLLPGKYDIIGYLPKPDELIYLFLDTEYGPKTCYIPWDAAKADKLKDDKEKGGSEFTISWGTGSSDGQGVPGSDNGGQISTRPPNENHPEKPPEEGAVF